jgi:hypothetical protein
LRHDRALGNALGYPEGVHVNFARIDPEGALSVLTYEAGVENITPACGTGSTAAAYVCARIGASALPTRVIVLGVSSSSAPGERASRCRAPRSTCRRSRSTGDRGRPRGPEASMAGESDRAT